MSKKLSLFANTDLYDKINVTIQDGGKSGVKSCVKLACKQLFTPDFTSEESPMLLVRQSRTEDAPS